MAKRTITIKLDDNTKEFYHNMFLARNLSEWVEEFKVLYKFYHDDDVKNMTDEDFVQKLRNKETAKDYLSASTYEKYLKYYDEIFVKEIA